MSREGAWRHEVEEASDQGPVNDRFRSYVQSTAFSLSLGRTHITALVHLEHGLRRRFETGRWPVNDTALAALQRRGLIVDKQPGVVKGAFREHPHLWNDHYEITYAGRLTLMLLAEAGLIPPSVRRGFLPPPPPGWTDPRPKIVFDENLEIQVQPSEREQAATT